jgi:uncharacterized membrane protein
MPSKFSLSKKRPNLPEPIHVWLALILVAALSTLLRFRNIGDESYWSDEMLSLRYAHLDQWSALFWDNTPPLYNFLLKIWMALLGHSEVITRGLSALFSVLATVLLFIFGCRWGGLRMGMAVSLCQAINPISITFSKEVRGYTLFELAAVVNLSVFFFFLKKKTSKKTLLASWVFLFLTSYISVGVMALEGLWIWGTSGSSRKKVGELLPLAGLLLLFVLIGGWAIRFHALPWLSSVLAPSPPGLFLWDNMGRSWISVFGYALLFIILPIVENKRRVVLEEVCALSFVLVPFFASFLAAYVGFPLRARYFIFTVPFFAFAVGLAATQGKVQIKTLVTIILASIFIILGNRRGLELAKVPKNPWREASQLVEMVGVKSVITTNKDRIEFPYFFDLNISVESSQGEDLTLLHLKERSNKNPFCLLDLQSSPLAQTFGSLERGLQAERVPVKGYSVDKHQAEPIEILCLGII